MYKIGEVTKQIDMSADTLRYYEKYGLISDISRTAAGIRQYTDKDISILKFIKRAQRMNFSLNEIKDLLSMRKDPQHAKDSVRLLTAEKLKNIESQLTELTTLRNELQLLLNLCRSSKDGCPIIEGIDAD
ncbi:hypothetical protein MNBD_GAMMA09-2818 [hydrothermal vent metagenome]|uniref:HTH merR-type domain-containing protein n=1 Tax=hydrothermal vent metagenome TaxID=652676 RepID=A0A3B0XRM1_9ZZZZ